MNPALDFGLCPVCHRHVPPAPLSSVTAGGTPSPQRSGNLKLKFFAAHAGDDGLPCSCRPSGEDALDDDCRAMIFSDPRWWEPDLQWEAPVAPPIRPAGPVQLSTTGPRELPAKLPTIRLNPIAPPPPQDAAAAVEHPAPKKKTAPVETTVETAAEDVDNWQP